MYVVHLAVVSIPTLFILGVKHFLILILRIVFCIANIDNFDYFIIYLKLFLWKWNFKSVSYFKEYFLYFIFSLHDQGIDTIWWLF